MVDGSERGVVGSGDLTYKKIDSVLQARLIEIFSKQAVIHPALLFLL